jgi:hypothetical protein
MPPASSCAVQYGLPEPEFWEEYAQLWRESQYQPAFQAPSYLRFLAESMPDKVAVFSFVSHERLKGAAFFRYQQGAYRFLSGIKADHNFFVLHEDCTAAEQAAFFERLLQEAAREGWTMILDKQPLWARYMSSFQRAGQQSGLFWEIFPKGVCPMVEEESSSSLIGHFNKRRIRYQLNRLRKHHGAVCEVLRDDEGLDEWVEQFCAAHAKRWKSATSMKKLETPEEKEFLKACLRAWAKDGILVRLSIRIGAERVSLIIGLIQQQALVGHAQAFDPAFQKYSPVNILHLFIAHWMSEQGLQVFDFGHGDHEYKYKYCNQKRHLGQINIAPKENVFFAVRVKVEKLLRGNAMIMLFYHRHIKPILNDGLFG